MEMSWFWPFSSLIISKYCLRLLFSTGLSKAWKKHVSSLFWPSWILFENLTCKCAENQYVGLNVVMRTFKQLAPNLPWFMSFLKNFFLLTKNFIYYGWQYYLWVIIDGHSCDKKISIGFARPNLLLRFQKNLIFSISNSL